MLRGALVGLAVFVVVAAVAVAVTAALNANYGLTLILGGAAFAVIAGALFGSAHDVGRR